MIRSFEHLKIRHDAPIQIFDGFQVHAQFFVRIDVIIHQPKLGLCKTREKLTLLPSCKLPRGYVKGKTGAGDAFCSGALIGIEQGMSDEDILMLAEAAAVASLTEQDATSGIMEKEQLLLNIARFER